MIASLILIGYPWRKIIASIIRWIGLKFITFILLILKFLIDLLPITEGTEDLVTEAGGGGILPAGENNYIFTFILWAIFFVLVFYVIYTNRTGIVAGFKETVEKIKAIIKTIGKIFFGKGNIDKAMDIGYRDTIEMLNSTDIMALTRNESLNKRKWKKQVKKYLKQDTRGISYREGYKLLLQGLALRGIQVREASTPREVMAEVNKRIGEFCVKEETLIYEFIRYGEVVENSNDMRKIQDLLQRLLVIHK